MVARRASTVVGMTYDVWLKTGIQSNLSKMATLGTEESGRCGEVAGVPGGGGGG